ncbi:recombinase RecT [Streptomyces cinereoruber]|uniref:recombinase RecT n=1 Tax=Streptomyces cinereoruber TaxID=67260 RepID=UPI00363984E1
MALNSLRDRVRAAVTPTVLVDGTVQELAEGVQSAPSDRMHEAVQGETGEVADLVATWLGRYGDEFTKALPSHMDAASFLASVRRILPDLVQCTPASLLQALLACARFGLLPDGRHAVITREGNVASFVPMAQGYVELMYRSGRVGSVHVGLIHEADEWSYEPTAPAPLDFVHKPAVTLPKAARGPVVLAYAFCWMTSGARSQVIVLSREDAEEIRDEYSTAYQRAKEAGRADSFWHTDFDRMWAKSTLRRLHKVVPLSAELVALAKVDDAGDAGEVQVVHAPAEDVQLLADAVAAHEAAEASQEPAAPAGPTRLRRKQPQRTSRKDRKATSVRSGEARRRNQTRHLDRKGRRKGGRR